MRLFTLAFLFGDVLLQQFSSLPSSVWIGGLIPFALMLWLANRKKQMWICQFIFAALLGFAWTLYYAHSLYSWSLPIDQEGKTQQLSGYIASLPNQDLDRVSFLFELDKQRAPILIKLSWQNHGQTLHVGDHWQLQVRLKRIHGMRNPGGFDYEAWALQEGIRASGYVVTGENNILIASHWYHHPIDRLRETLRNKIATSLPSTQTSPWITALAIGERSNIAAENWQVLRNTGTNHLMAIAGLHIGFMSGFIFVIISWLWCRSEYLTLRFPAQHAGAIGALAVALIYSALSGFAIPTQRACIMLTVALIILLLRRKIMAWLAWSIAVLTVLLMNPLSVLTESFWLSFGSVALIIYGISGRLSPKGWWWKLGRMQWVVALGLVPMSIWLFQQCSLVSFIANSIAIPWVGFMIVPLTLLGCFFLIFSATFGGLILWLADKLLALLWCILAYLSHLSWASWYQVIPIPWILIAASIGVVILLFPAGFPGRWLGLIALLPMILYHAPQPPNGEVWLNLLDVGQGLSAVVQTQHHVMVFDAGPRLSSNYDMGESVVMPFLHSIGAHKISLLIVSHGDNDHIGGVNALLQYFPIKIIKTSVPEKFTTHPAELCQRGETWRWDNVTFSILHPSLSTLHLGNDSSCVLRIENSYHQSVLLTGDIEKAAEKDLVANTTIASTILVAPHHGSKTSATNAFVHSVNPAYVLYAVGYRNRYHFPNNSVVQTYTALNTHQYRTDQTGAMQFKLAAQVDIPNFYRQQNKYYWNN